MALDANNAEMLLVSGRRLRRAGQPDAAIKLIQRAVDIDPNRGAFYAELGEAYLAMPNGTSNAIQQLKQAVSRVPNNARLFGLLGEAYRRANDPEHAQAAWLAAIKADPDAADAHLGLARMYLAKGDAARAHGEYEAVSRHAQGATLAEADSELGRVAMDKGDNAKAKDFFESALKASDKYPPPYFYYGKILAADRAQKPKARALFQEYLRIAPDGPFAADAKRLSR
jgi:tetratricopeptide (TPR) repeat protein